MRKSLAKYRQQARLRLLMYQSSPLENNYTYRRLLYEPANAWMQRAVGKSYVEQMQAHDFPATTKKRLDGTVLNVWEVQHAGASYLVYSAKGFGTTIERVDLNGDEDEGNVIFAFVVHYLTQLVGVPAPLSA